MEIVNFKEYKKNTLRGFVDVKLSTGVILREFTYHVKDDVEWVSPPARPYKTEDGEEKWSRIVDFETKEIYRNFSNQVVKLLKLYIQAQGG